MTRRQALIAIAAGIVGLASSAIFAKLPSDTSKIKSAGVNQSEIKNKNAIKPFVMYF